MHDIIVFLDPSLLGKFGGCSLVVCAKIVDQVKMEVYLMSDHPLRFYDWISFCLTLPCLLWTVKREDGKNLQQKRSQQDKL